MATNGNVNLQEGQADHPATQQQANPSSSNIDKDEVAWYFVSQFYKTLSGSPDKLHLFYGKRSQFVYGQEAEVTITSVGRQSIQERIKDLEFQDCKVRVTNVDAQASGENIVIQVIGELSTKSGEPKKFVQTFVLAQQPSGYFVLNDIMRYIDEGLDEEEAQAAPEAGEAPATAEPEAAVPIEGRLEPESSPIKEEEPVKEAEAAPLDAAKVDQKLEDVSSSAPTETAPAAAATEKSAEPAVEAEPAIVKTKEDAKPEPVSAEKALKEIEKEEAKEDTPKEPSPTPAAPRAAPAEKPAPAQPEKPKEPPKPMTWASRIAAAVPVAAKAIVPSIPKVATPPAQPRQAAPAAAQKAPAPAAPAPEAAASAPKDPNDEWQSVGADSKRQNRPVSISGPQQTGQEGAMAYIKFVTEKIQMDDLRAELAQYGELAYFDVNRTKNCAFVEFKTPAGYNAAVAANPHTVNGETITVEQRRPKANAYGGSNYSGNRGGAANRGRGGFEGQRQNSQGAPRTGGFQGQSRGRGGSARGGARAGSQTTA